MQTNASASPAPTPPQAPVTKSRRWGYWTIILGGLLVAAGVFLTHETLYDLWYLTAANPCAPVAVPTSVCSISPYNDYVRYSAVGLLLLGAGFLLAFVGIAVTLRRSLAPSPAITRWTFLTLLLGGLLVAVGLAGLAWETWSTLSFYLTQQTVSSYDALYSLDLASRVFEAVGLFVAFLGVANAIRR